MAYWALVLPLFHVCQVWAIPGFSSHWGGNSFKLTGVPDIGDYEKLVYPKLDIQDGGSFSHADLTKIVRVSDKAVITQPKPYPVHVPYKVPYPVSVPKPFPVKVPHFVKVPHPVPVEVIKKVPVPYEVPKPYPVSSHEYQGGNQGHDESGSWSPSGYSAGVGEDYKQLAEDIEDIKDAYSAGQNGGISSYENAGLEHADGDSSADFPSVAEQENASENTEQVHESIENSEKN